MENAKLAKLCAISQQIGRNNVTPELASSSTQLVFGAGNVNADLVFVGEAPGKQEDLSGQPFVGAAGKFLDEMLGMIKLKRKDIYITNIVKYRPPNNRDPLPEEKQAFLPYLQKQLEVIRPKLLITLGRHSLNCFVPKAQISKVHGMAEEINLNYDDSAENRSFSVTLLPLFHPAAALYNGSMRQTLINDFLLIPSIANKI